MPNHEVYIKRKIFWLYKAKDDLVNRLNKIQKTIERTDTLIERVRLKLQWIDEKTTTIERIQKHIAHVRILIEEHDSTERHQNVLIDQQQLLKITLSSINEGYVRETSYTP
jgi:hypothetical protein